jgi:hypothetical protein
MKAKILSDKKQVREQHQVKKPKASDYDLKNSEDQEAFNSLMKAWRDAEDSERIFLIEFPSDEQAAGELLEQLIPGGVVEIEVLPGGTSARIIEFLESASEE